ncbi:MAG: DUF4230 domain-containing protein [Bdellovibrionota bacterium]
MILAKGKVQFGYDLVHAKTEVDPVAKKIIVSNAKVVINSTDFNYEYLFEKDTFLNPITPNDRNHMLDQIKSKAIAQLKPVQFEKRVKEKTDELLAQLKGFTSWTIEVRS